MSPELRYIYENHEKENKMVCDYMLSDIFSLGLSILQATLLLHPFQL